MTTRFCFTTAFYLRVVCLNASARARNAYRKKNMPSIIIVERSLQPIFVMKKVKHFQVYSKMALSYLFTSSIHINEVDICAAVVN